MKHILTNNQYIYYYLLKQRNDDILNYNVLSYDSYCTDIRPYLYTYISQTEDIQRYFINFFNIYLRKCDLTPIKDIQDIQSSVVHQACFVIAIQYYFL